MSALESSLTPQSSPRLSWADFARKIKAKYPDYAEIGDNDLVDRILKKYPEYNDQIDWASIDTSQQSQLEQAAQSAGQQVAALKSQLGALSHPKGGGLIKSGITAPPSSDAYNRAVQSARQSQGQSAGMSGVAGETALQRQARLRSTALNPPPQLRQLSTAVNNAEWQANTPNALTQLPRPVRYVAEMLALGGAGIEDAVAGAINLATSGYEQRYRKIDNPSEAKKAINWLRAQSKGTRETSAQAQRREPFSTLPRIGQEVGAGLVEFAPVMAATGGAGAIPTALAGGAYSGAQASGRGESLPNVAKSAAIGTAQFGLMGVPAASMPLKSALGRAVVKIGLVGTGSAGLAKVAGASNEEALKSGLVMATLASPELLSGLRWFRHADFGEVVQSPDQGGVTKGKLRVLDQDGNNHTIIKPSRARNVRAVPLNEVPDVPVSTIDRPRIVKGAPPNDVAAITSPTLANEANTVSTKATEGVGGLVPSENVPPVPEGHTRFYRADHVDAEGPLGKGWAPRDPEYVSQKYGKGQMGSETIWYRDVPNSELDAEHGDHRAVGILNTDALDHMKGTEPKLFRRVQEDSPATQPPAPPASPSTSVPAVEQSAAPVPNGLVPASAQPETPQLVTAVPNGTQMLLKFTRKGGAVSDENLRSLFPENHVTIERTYNALTPEFQGVKLTFWNKEGMRQVKAPADAIERLGLAKPLYTGQEAELAVPDHPDAARIVSGQISPDVLLDTPIANQVKEAINEANNIQAAAQSTISGTEVSPAMVGENQTGPRTSAQEGIAPPPIAGERQFPKSAEAAGLPLATDLTYQVVTDRAAVDRAAQRIERDGTERVIADLANAKELTKDDVAVASLLAHQLDAAGDTARAIDVIDILSPKLTTAAQAVQGASVIARLSPEGILLKAQREMPAGQKLTPEQGVELIAQAKRVVEAEVQVAALTKELEQLKGNSGEPPTSKRSARERIGTLQDRLSKMEADARARLDQRAAKAKAELTGDKSQRGSGVNPVGVGADIADLTIIGAAKLAQKGMTLAKWTEQMVREFGEDVRPRLQSLYKDSYALYDEQRKQFAQESKERSARRAEPDATNLQEVINTRADAQTQARKARLELTRIFNDLNKTPLQKAGRGAIDVLNLPRALTTTLDLSAALRQGKMGLLRHPKIFLDAFLKQFKALNTEQYERMISNRELDPQFKYTRRFGLDLTTGGESGRLGGHEEAFQSGFVKDIPVVKHSEQAYATMLDELRFGWFKDYMGHLEKMGLSPENPADFQAFKEGGQLINNATGRGNLGRIQGATPALNTIFFSPRFWASRLKLLSLPFDPRTYTQMSAPARVEAFKTLFSFAGLVSSQLALAKLSGAKVGLNPDDPDFLKAAWGPVHVDFSAGFQNHIRVALKLIKAMSSDKPKQTPAEILGSYARSKESPNASLVHDLFFSKKVKADGKYYGTDFKGDPTSLLGLKGNRMETSALAKRLTPMALQDAVEAIKQLGLKGTPVIPLSVFGEGVSVYDPNKKHKGLRPPPIKRPTGPAQLR